MPGLPSQAHIVLGYYSAYFGPTIDNLVMPKAIYAYAPYWQLNAFCDGLVSKSMLDFGQMMDQTNLIFEQFFPPFFLKYFYP